MTREDFIASDEYTKSLVIGTNKGKMLFRYNAANDGIICGIVEENGNKHSYDVYDYFRLYISYDAFEATKNANESEQAKILVRTKSDVVHMIESLRRLIRDEPFKDVYHLDGFISECDVLIGMAQVNLQSSLLESQIATNKNVISTNGQIVKYNVIV